MQTEILAANPSALLRSYAIWFNMYPGDERSKWDDSLIIDSRVTFYWDEETIVGRRLIEDNVVGYPYEILWDAYLLFGPEAEWDAVLTTPMSWGDPVYRRKQELKDVILPLLRD